MEISPQLREAVQKAARDGQITCTQARKVAEKFGVSPLLIGKVCDILELKIKACELGCF